MTGFQTRFGMILLASLLAGAPSMAQPLSFFPQQRYDSPLMEDEFDLDPESIEPESGEFELPSHLRRQIVGYPTREAPGTVIVDTPNTYLYFVLGNGRAIRYGIGVGREGFTWSGVRAIDRKAEWPDWAPPAQMIARQPYLPRWFAGGPSNPLGARALYVGGTLYRIHGTNQPSSIGKRVSSGCIRLANDDIIDLHSRVRTGTKVVVLPATRVANAKRRAPVEPIEEFNEREDVDVPVSRPPASVARPLFPNPFGMN